MARGNNKKQASIRVSTREDAPAGAVKGAFTLDEIKALQASLPPENPDYNPDSYEDTKNVTVNDAKQTILRNGQYSDYKDLTQNPYAKRILNLTAEDVRKVLANPDMKSAVMSNLSGKGGQKTNLVTRDKYGNWFARERGARNWVAIGDWSAVVNPMLDKPEFAKTILDFLNK